MELQLALLDRAAAERVVRRRRQPGDPLWDRDYPLDGDSRACAAYAARLPLADGAGATDVFGYYQVIEAGGVIGGIGFHGPPVAGVVEVGYGVVPSARRRGVATEALRLAIDIAAGAGAGRCGGTGSAGGAGSTVKAIVGRTTSDNIASQRVMLHAGMQLVGRDPDFLHFEMRLTPPGRSGIT